MTTQEKLKDKKMSIYQLVKASELPYTTVNDIYSGKAQLEKCSAETIYKIAHATNVSMEGIRAVSVAGRNDVALKESEKNSDPGVYAV